MLLGCKLNVLPLAELHEQTEQEEAATAFTGELTVWLTP